MLRRWYLCLSCVGWIVLGHLCVSEAATITISCGAVGKELNVCRQGAQSWAQKTGHTVKLVSTPDSSTERLALYQQLLAAGSSDIDVFQVDVIWPGILAHHFIDLKPYAGKHMDDFFPVMIKNDFVQGRSWYVGAGLLYYRKDLLDKYHEKVPQTWEELTATAKKIQDAERAAGHPKMWGYIWQGRAYEGLTCNALEWVASYRGGTIVDPDGKITINNPHAVKALDMASGWIRTITPLGVLNYTEEESRALFQSGNAVFMRNWPYVWALANADKSPVKGKVGVTALPQGGATGVHAAALGGWQLAVSKYSKHPALAADLVMYLTSVKEQKRRAIAAAFSPTIPRLYQDPDVLAANPFSKDFYSIVSHAVARPSTAMGTHYNQASTFFWNAVHTTLSGEAPAQSSLSNLSRQLHRIQHVH